MKKKQLRLRDLGELALIKRIAEAPQHKEILVGIGDDAAVIRGKKTLYVMTTDCIVESRHFTRRWLTPVQIGKKAIEVNVSDIAAMGGTPCYALISLILPPELRLDFFDRMYQGIQQTCKKYRIAIVGGNMSAGKNIIVSVTLIGTAVKKNLCTRAGAKPGDLIFVTGALGGSRAGLELLQKNISGFSILKNAYREPHAALQKARHNAQYARAMIDISDGLASELGHICAQSNCGAWIYLDKLPIPAAIKNAAAVLHKNPYDWALHGGDDYEILGTVPPKYARNIRGIIIGEITKTKAIFLIAKNKKQKIIPFGFEHFAKCF